MQTVILAWHRGSGSEWSESILEHVLCPGEQGAFMQQQWSKLEAEGCHLIKLDWTDERGLIEYRSPNTKRHVMVVFAFQRVEVGLEGAPV